MRSLEVTSVVVSLAIKCPGLRCQLNKSENESKFYIYVVCVNERSTYEEDMCNEFIDDV